jgi:ABC-2 type transport system permease protein
MLHRLIALILKELQSLLGDPDGRKLLIAPVIMQLLLFPHAATLDVKNVTLGIYNQDHGAEGLELVQRLSEAEAFTKIVPIRSEPEFQSTIEGQKALLAVQLPEDFSAKLARGEDVQVQAVLDGRRSNAAQIALGYVNVITQDYQEERLQEGAGGRVLAPPSELLVRHWFNPNLHYHWFIVPSLVAIICTISTLIVTAMSVAREREQGTFDQLLVSPLTPGMIMVGKAVPAIIISFAQATIILTAAIFVYKVPFHGNMLYLYGSMFFYVTALVGFGLFISSLCSTQQQAFLGVFSFMMPAVLLSGFASPVENMPKILQWISWIDPLSHFIIIVKGLFLKAMPFHDVIHHAWPLLLISAVMLSLADWIFHHRLN